VEERVQQQMEKILVSHPMVTRALTTLLVPQTS
jgi:hypothetical protein